MQKLIDKSWDLLEKGKSRRAIFLLWVIFIISFGQPWVANRLGMTYGRSNKFRRSKYAFKYARKLDLNSNVSHNLGLVYVEEGNYRKALWYFKEAYRQEKSFTRCIALAKAYSLNNNSKQANKYLRIAFELEHSPRRRDQLKSMIVETSDSIPVNLKRHLDRYRYAWDIRTLDIIDATKAFMEQVYDETSKLLVNIDKRSDYRHMRSKKLKLINSVSLACHYYESIIVLLNNNNSNAAKLVLRSMIETNINTHFTYITKDNTNLNRQIKYELNMKLISTIGAKKYALAKNLGNNDFLKEEKVLRGHLRSLKQYPDYPNMFNRAVAVDRHFKKSMTVVYNKWFSSLSDVVHSGSDVLSSIGEQLHITNLGNFNEYEVLATLATIQLTELAGLAENKVLNENSYIKNVKTITENYYMKHDKVYVG